ncbi:MAG: hypothetical protein MMC23_007940 [Stictis urceolatum]|nr:hypothetical protein [Stictis urceolata]
MNHMGGRRGKPRVTPDIPSWAVDWVRPEATSKHALNYWPHNNRHGLFNASYGQFRPPALGPARVLNVEGYMCGLVMDVSSITRYDLSQHGNWWQFEDPSTVLRWYDTYKQWLNGLSEDTPYVGGGSKREAFWRTIFGDTVQFATGIPEGSRRARPEDEALFNNYLDKTVERDMLVVRRRTLLYREAFVGFVGWFDIRRRSS